MKRFIILTAFLALSASSLKAQQTDVMFLAPDAATAAVAGATVASPANAYAVYGNAASMSLSKARADFAATYSMLGVKDESFVSLGGYYRITDRLAAGVGGRYFMMPSFPTTEDGFHFGSYTPRNIFASLGLSYMVIDGLSIGLSGKVLHFDSYIDSRKTTFCGAVSLEYRWKDLSAALVLDNAGPQPMPMDIRMGLSYDGHFGIVSVLPSLQADILPLEGGAFSVKAGAELGVKDIVFVRGGYSYGTAKGGMLPSYGSAGIAVTYFGVHLDFAYLISQSKGLNGTMMFTLGYSF